MGGGKWGNLQKIEIKSYKLNKLNGNWFYNTLNILIKLVAVLLVINSYILYVLIKNKNCN